MEDRIRDAIQNWHVRYFKFDFMTWLDCASQNDFYQHHDAFLAMVDRLRRDFPDVTFQTDDTNDYRLFPFESTLRGPLWFQNGSPDPSTLLHNLWITSPYVPAYTIGQAALGGDQGGKMAWERFDVGTLMAAALPSHVTIWRDLRTIPAPVVSQVARWIADLDSAVFADREKAARQLERQGELAETQLRKALAGDPSPEVRRRLEGLLSKLLQGPAASGETPG